MPDVELNETDPAWAVGDWPGLRRVHAAAAERAAKVDTNWLARSPTLTHYVRPIVPHELCVEGEPCRRITGWVRVWIPRPGVRLRREALP